MRKAYTNKIYLNDFAFYAGKGLNYSEANKIVRDY